jgi:hypothetical protein
VLLCASESRAFGPTATLMAIVTHIGNGVDCDFAGPGTALHIATESQNIFRQITALKTRSSSSAYLPRLIMFCQ